ncbi:NACHT, LRR and PYD domains-containing protein 12-like isoform X2 [Macrotis lagotis]|uniref:NACHT, LRR and PYD domains-containing protein 12-like isoform X2 n=1 Tax=Macrotis lagotis TaxID=92651 RepID=UPI003D685A3F
MEETVRGRLLQHLEHLTSEELEKFKLFLLDYIPRGLLEGANRAKVADLLVSLLTEQEAWELALIVWEKMGQMELLERARMDVFSSTRRDQKRNNDERIKYRERVREKFQFIREKNLRPGEHELFHQRFTQLLLLREFRIKEEKQHELLAQGWEHSQVIEERGQFIEVSALFDPDQRTGDPPHTVVLQGAAGIGKTTLAIKVMLDWAKENLYQERFNYVFYLSCRELNSLGERKISFANLIVNEWPDPWAPLTEIMSHPERLLFIIDGLDELKFPCNEHRFDLCKDWKQQRPVSLLLSSLLRKTLLPEASLLLTTRLTALGKFSPLLENPRHVEILGFSVEHRKEYFCKFFGNVDLGKKVFSLIEDNNVLFTMCSVPLMNWIVCTCLKQQKEKGRDPVQALKTTTALYMCYINSIIPDDKTFVPQHLKGLCSLAAEGIWEKKILFEEEDLRRHDLEAVNVSAFLNLNIFQKDSGYENCYSFIHLSFQEFFAALFYVMSTDKEGVRRPDSSIPDVKKLLEEYSRDDASFVELVVRFLFGFLNAETARDLEKKFRCSMSPEIKSQLLQWAEGENQRDYEGSWYPSAHLPLWYSFVYETQDAEFASQVLNNVHEIKVDVFSHYEALNAVFCIKHCPRAWRIFFSCRFVLPDGIWQDLFSVVSKNQNLKELFVDPKKSSCPWEKLCVELRNANCKLEKLRLENTKGTYSGFQGLCSVPTLKSLHLNNISFETDYMKLPWESLGKKNCQLQTLSLQFCHFKNPPSQILSSALNSNEILKTLDLRGVSFKETEIELLWKVLENPKCKIETLRMHCHNIKNTHNLLSALNNNVSLKNLYLKGISFNESERKVLGNDLGNPNCKIEKLRFQSCHFNTACFQNFFSASNESLKHLDFSDTWFAEENINLLCKTLENPNCKIETLRLQLCHFITTYYQNFFSALNSNESLKNLDMSDTFFKEEKIKFLCKFLEDPNCKIERLRLQSCHFNTECFQNLFSALNSNKSLKNLDLSKTFFKKQEDINLLGKAFENRNCKIETLSLQSCHFNTECSQNFFSALKSNESLKNLDLSKTLFDKVKDINLLGKVLENPNCKIEALSLKNCKISYTDLETFFSALSSNKSLKNLDLRQNSFKKEDIELLCKALGNQNSNIEELRLSCNLPLACLQDLFHVTWRSKSLKTLTLRNSFQNNDKGIKLLCEALENQNCKLQTLRLWIPNLSEESVRALTNLKSRKFLQIIWEGNVEEMTEFFNWDAEEII